MWSGGEQLQFPLRSESAGGSEDICPFWWGYGYPYYNYGDYADHRYYGYDPGASYYGNYPDYGHGSHPNTRQTWYYCSDPAGYYPYVTQCKTGWQSVPAS